MYLFWPDIVRVIQSKFFVDLFLLLRLPPAHSWNCTTHDLKTLHFLAGDPKLLLFFCSKKRHLVRKPLLNVK